MLNLNINKLNPFNNNKAIDKARAIAKANKAVYNSKVDTENRELYLDALYSTIRGGKK